jgi:hypothetical protein
MRWIWWLAIAPAAFGQTHSTQYCDLQAPGSRHCITIKAPATVGSNIGFTWPGALPGSTQCLQSDTAGVFAFGSCGGVPAGVLQTLVTHYATTSITANSETTIYSVTLPANTLTTNGDAVLIRYNFELEDTGTFSLAHFLEVSCFRATSTTLYCSNWVGNSDGLSSAAVGSSAVNLQLTGAPFSGFPATYTGFDFTTNITIKLSGIASASALQVFAKIGTAQVYFDGYSGSFSLPKIKGFSGQVLFSSGTATGGGGGGGGPVSMGGDVTGTSAASTVAKLQGRTFASTSPTSGQVIAWNSGSSQWEPTSSSIGTPGGDVSGSIGALTVIKIQGRDINSAAPSSGQVLAWNSGTSKWEATSLGGGGAVTLGGDVTGSTASTTVARIQGRDMSASAPSTNQVIAWNGSTWAPASLPATGGDLSGAIGSATVTGLQGRGVSSSAPSTNQVLTWNGSAWAPANAGAATVSSVFGRTGAVVAASGDYTAAQVTDAVDTTGSYSNPTWLASLDAGKLTTGVLDANRLPATLNDFTVTTSTHFNIVLQSSGSFKAPNGSFGADTGSGNTGCSTGVQNLVISAGVITSWSCY